MQGKPGPSRLHSVPGASALFLLAELSASQGLSPCSSEVEQLSAGKLLVPSSASTLRVEAGRCCQKEKPATRTPATTAITVPLETQLEAEHGSSSRARFNCPSGGGRWGKTPALLPRTEGSTESGQPPRCLGFLFVFIGL